MSGRVPTGIDGLDPLIEGVFLRGDVILVVGGTGSASLRGLFSDQISFGKEGIQTIKLSKAAEVDKIET